MCVCVCYRGGGGGGDVNFIDVCELLIAFSGILLLSYAEVCHYRVNPSPPPHHHLQKSNSVSCIHIANTKRDQFRIRQMDNPSHSLELNINYF